MPLFHVYISCSCRMSSGGLGIIMLSVTMLEGGGRMSIYQKIKHVRFRIIVFLIVLALLLTLIWASQPATFSHLVMKVVSSSAEAKGVAAQSGLNIQFENPESSKMLNWFSEMCLYNVPDLSEKDLGLEGNREFELSIYYTFGDFKNGRSLVYEVESEYHNAFYGAYVIKGLGDISDNQAVLEAVARYDYTKLILSGLGYAKQQISFEPVSASVASKITYCGSDNWNRWDATVKTRSVNHRVTSNLQHYVQFGKPALAEQTPEFGETQLYGRMYAKYFNEQEVCVIFYIMTPDQVLLTRTDEQLLSKTSIRLP